MILVVLAYYGGRPISSCQVAERSVHVGYEWVLTNVSMTRGNFFEAQIISWLE